MGRLEELEARASNAPSGGGPCWVSNLTDPEAKEFWGRMIEREVNGLYVNRSAVVTILDEEFGIQISRTTIKDHLAGRCKSCRKG